MSDHMCLFPNGATYSVPRWQCMSCGKKYVLNPIVKRWYLDAPPPQTTSLAERMLQQSRELLAAARGQS